eukprot:scaffold187480_cov18-Tisochrysis_lutea.AAC.1
MARLATLQHSVVWIEACHILAWCGWGKSYPGLVWMGHVCLSVKAYHVITECGLDQGKSCRGLVWYIPQDVGA